MPRPHELSRRLGLALSVALGVFFAPLLVVPATAGAYATIAPENIFSSAPGLPDGRVYEQVSPADKNGNEAGAENKHASQDVNAEQHHGLAEADGNSVYFEGTGPMGEVATALTPDFVATKNKGDAGWSTRGISPAPLLAISTLTGTGTVARISFALSSDFSHAMFTAGKEGETYAPLPEQCRGGQLYLTGSDPFVTPTWLEKTESENPAEVCQGSASAIGGTPDFSTVYFTYSGKLLPEDAARKAGSGFYEYTEGALRETGVLPDGSLDPFGAAPPATSPAQGNEVSADGSRAFFISPAPGSGSPEPPELYVRENGQKTLLVSKDTLLPALDGLPAPAPAGVLPASAYAELIVYGFNAGDSYVFASPDGSQAFFQSDDQLTGSAPEGPPANTSPKTYDFDVDTGGLTYLPNVAGQILATDSDGSVFTFLRPEAGGQPPELDLWSAGPAGGTVTPITRLTGPEQYLEFNGQYIATPRAAKARVSSDGSVLVFTSTYSLPGAFNSGSDLEQVYRYDVPANTLGCISCPPHGVTPNVPFAGAEQPSLHTGFGAAARGISSDGDRVFFETPDPLVPQDTNTGTTVQRYDDGYYLEAQGRDVYEWENGVVYLISSGKSPVNSYFLDNSENGDDVFFATAEGLVPGDTDGAFDVYDARVPHPGDNPPPAAVPCEGSVCQGPPSVRSPLAPPARATLPGTDNLTSEPAETPPPKKTTTKTVRCKKGLVKTKNKCARKAKPKKAKKSSRGSK